MSQRNWALYLLGKGNPNENINIGWSPGIKEGKQTPNEVKKHILRLEAPISSPKNYGTIVSESYKFAGRGGKRKTRRNRLITRRNRRVTRYNY